MTAIEFLYQSISENRLWQKDVELQRNEYLKVKGSTDTLLYFVEEGTLRAYLMEEGEELTIRFGYQGDFIAALDSFISESPSELYIQSIKKCRLKCIRKQDYLELINSTEELKEIWVSMMQGLILQQMERERDILTTSPAERYQRVLKRSPRLFQEIPSKYIASYLRMTPETLSRIKKD